MLDSDPHWNQWKSTKLLKILKLRNASKFTCYQNHNSTNNGFNTQPPWPGHRGSLLWAYWMY
jgi:hypothetical protein